jgi:Lysozyme like domain
MAPPVLPVILLGTGAYLAFFGVHYWRSDVKWPTTPVKDVLTGKGLTSPGAKPQTEQAAIAAEVAGASATENTQAASPAAPAVPQAQTGDTGVTGGTYTHATLMTLWGLNGGASGTADIAAAIAMAESSGRSTVTSPNSDGGTNVGLWQLDTRGKGAGYTVAQLQNPDTNARVAVFGSANGTNWSAWETFATGAYKQFLS